eukprot:scaffold3514_cov58-Cylindrotheca_fusiformis.AAC.2
MDIPSNDARIACLLPSATAICVALGLEERIVGVTHECRKPLSTQEIHVLTKNGLTVDSQGEIHQAIMSSSSAPTCNNLEDVPSFYPLLQEQFDRARPNIVLTQDLCGVCAPTSADVRKITHQNTTSDETIRIVSLEPTTLDMVADSFVTVAKVCGVEER